MKRLEIVNENAAPHGNDATTASGGGRSNVRLLSRINL